MNPITLSNGAVIDFSATVSDAGMVFGAVIAISVLLAGFYIVKGLVKGGAR